MSKSPTGPTDVGPEACALSHEPVWHCDLRTYCTSCASLGIRAVQLQVALFTWAGAHVGWCPRGLVPGFKIRDVKPNAETRLRLARAVRRALCSAQALWRKLGPRSDFGRFLDLSSSCTRKIRSQSQTDRGPNRPSSLSAQVALAARACALPVASLSKLMLFCVTLRKR